MNTPYPPIERPPTVTAAAATDIGRRRTSNEDAFCCRPDLGLFVVADGMGGHAAGEVASRLAVDTIEAFVDETRDKDVNRPWPFPYDTTLGVDGNRLKAAFRLANRRLASAIEADDALRGMATTGVALLVSDATPAVAHLGDSRLYLQRDARLQPLTRDHSWVGEQVRAGLITDAGARQHPWRNVVTRALAGGDDPEVEVTALSLRPGDRLILCTDGLSGVIAADRFASIAAGRGGLDDICRQFVDAANEAGGPDNITVVMIEIDSAADRRRPAASRHRSAAMMGARQPNGGSL